MIKSRPEKFLRPLGNRSPFEHQVCDGGVGAIADGMVQMGRIVDERTGAQSFDTGAFRRGPVRNQNIGFPIEDDQQFLFDMLMRRMGAMTRTQEREMTRHIVVRGRSAGEQWEWTPFLL